MSRSQSHSRRAGFTMVELLVAIAVLAIILVAAGQILSTTGTLTTVNNKHMDANDQARMVFDRMADDFARMVRRKDVDYLFWKATGNDVMYFYTEGASYFDSATFNAPTGIPSGATNNSEKNPVSLVGYRVNNNGGATFTATTTTTDPSYYQLERLGKALSWDGGAYNSTQSATLNSRQPNFVAFLTYPPAGYDVINGNTTTGDTTNYIDPTLIPYSTAFFNSTLAGAYSNTGFSGLPSAVGTEGGNFNDSKDTSYRTVGSQVFRFEYCFQLKDGTMSAIPVMTPSTANSLPNSFLGAGQRPFPTDDSNGDSSGDTGTNGTANYVVGSRWYDTSNQIGYICLDATPNAAVWHEIGIQDVAAIIVTIAVIDKQGLIYVQKSGIDLATVAALLPDYATGNDPAYLLDPTNQNGWAYALLPSDTTGVSTILPQSMTSQIRLYQRYFYLNTY